MSLDYKEMDAILMRELRLYHHPMAVTWLFTEEDVAEFVRVTPHYTPVKQLSFCQWEVAARMQGKTVLGRKKDMDCAGGLISFGWREADDKYVQSLARYCEGKEQTERFVAAKPRMELGAL